MILLRGKTNMKKLRNLKTYEAKFVTYDIWYAWETFEATNKAEAERIANDILQDKHYKRIVYIKEIA